MHPSIFPCIHPSFHASIQNPFFLCSLPPSPKPESQNQQQTLDPGETGGHAQCELEPTAPELWAPKPQKLGGPGKRTSPNLKTPSLLTG